MATEDIHRGPTLADLIQIRSQHGEAVMRPSLSIEGSLRQVRELLPSSTQIFDTGSRGDLESWGQIAGELERGIDGLTDEGKQSLVLQGIGTGILFRAIAESLRIGAMNPRVMPEEFANYTPEQLSAAAEHFEGMSESSRNLYQEVIERYLKSRSSSAKAVRNNIQALGFYGCSSTVLGIPSMQEVGIFDVELIHDNEARFNRREPVSQRYALIEHLMLNPLLGARATYSSQDRKMTIEELLLPPTHPFERKM